MFRYFKIQLKRILRLLPGVLCVCMILCGCLFIAYQGILEMDSADEANSKIAIAVVGDTEDPFLQMGISALTNLDSSRYMLEVLSMDRDAATEALEQGKVAVVAVIPDGFVEEALMGHMLPIEYISAHGAASIVSALKDEVTVVATDILLAAQKGIYGTWNAMWDLGLYDTVQDAVNAISIRFASNVFSRANGYGVTELGISDDLNLQEYLICGISVLLLMLITLPFASVLIKRDNALSQILQAKCIGVGRQVLCEMLAYFLCLLAVVSALVLLISAAGLPLNIAESFRCIAAITIMIGTLSFFVFELSGNLITGILLMFFLSIGLCFAGGCLYPAYFFPEAIQRIADILPTGVARSCLASCFVGQPVILSGVYAYALLFTVFSFASRMIWQRTGGRGL